MLQLQAVNKMKISSADEAYLDELVQFLFCIVRLGYKERIDT